VTANLAHRRPDAYGPLHPWNPMNRPTDADIRDRIARLMAAAKMAATFTPDTADDGVFAALDLLSREPKFVKAVRTIVDALPQHRPAVVQQLFGEGM